MSKPSSKLGLVLTGGGARAAYQAGALRGIVEVAKEFGKTDQLFQVISGVSAGSINGLHLASHCSNYDFASKKLWDLWANLEVDEIFETHSISILKIALRIIRNIIFGGAFQSNFSNHLLNTSPLYRLLKREIDFDQLRENIHSAKLTGAAVTATNYSNGLAVTYFDTNEKTQAWYRPTRISKQTEISLNHVMASTSIPFFFPPIRIGNAHYGDGAVRFKHPLSPAIHLGADRIIAVSVRHVRTRETMDIGEGPAKENVSFADIASTTLNSLFLDGLDSDVERLNRINRTLDLLNLSEIESETDKLRKVPILAISPSEDLGALAPAVFKNLPLTLRFLLGGIGTDKKKGSDLLSYLAFDRSYTTVLLELGRSDAHRFRQEIKSFL